MAVADFVAGKGEFAKKFQAAKRPLIIVGSSLAEHADGAAVYNALAKFVDANKEKLVTPEWNGFSVLQRVCRLCSFHIIWNLVLTRHGIVTGRLTPGCV